jgi:hypothetical protein
MAPSLLMKRAACFLREIELSRTWWIPSEIYSKFSTKAIAESLVYRFFKKNEYKSVRRTDVIRPYVDLYHDTSLLMAIKIENFESILNTGFLNQFQVGASSGKYDPTARDNTEIYLMKIFFGHSLQPQGAENFVRPKYAYLTFDVDKAGIDRAWVTAQYGNIFVRFKDEVKKRSTFSNGDSLDFMTRPRGYKFSFGDFHQYSFFYNQENFEIQNLASYYEAQIYGPLDSKDIDYILVGCFNGIPSYQEQVIAMLKAKKSKTPVFSCRSISGNNPSEPKWLTFKPQDKLYPL